MGLGPPLGEWWECVGALENAFFASLSPAMKHSSFLLTRVAQAAGLLCVLGTAPLAYAVPACSVTEAGGQVPAGCMTPLSWTGTGQYEPSLIAVTAGGQFSRPGGLILNNSNTSAPGPANTGTQGIVVDGVAGSGTRSTFNLPSAVRVTVDARNVSNVASNEGVLVRSGALAVFGNGLTVSTQTDPVQPSLTATGVEVMGVSGAFASSLNSNGSLNVDTTQAATTTPAVYVADRGYVEINGTGGGTIASANTGITVASNANFANRGGAYLQVQGKTGVMTVDGGADLGIATLMASNSAVVMRGGTYQQSGGSMLSMTGSDIVFVSGVSTVRLSDVGVETRAGTGVGPDGYEAGLALYAKAGRAFVDLSGASIMTGGILTEAAGKLVLNIGSGALWDADTVNINNVLTAITGAGGRIQVPDITNTITLMGNDAGVAFPVQGCGNANLTLVVPTQSAPPYTPYPVMECRNAAAYPTVTLQGGSVTLGGYQYTLQTSAADGRATYQLVRGAVALLATTVGGASSQNPAVVSTPVTLTATVTTPTAGSNPGGTVAFNDNGVPIAGCSAQLLSAASATTATATCTTSTLPAGSHPITVVYGGDATHAGSSSSVLTQVITSVTAPLAQTITFGAAPNMAVGGTGAVSASASSGLPETLTAGPASVCTLVGTTLTGVSAGLCTVTASQAGDSRYAPAPQAIQTVTIKAAATGEPTPVPTLSQWGLLLLSGLLAAFTGWDARRRSRSA